MCVWVDISVEAAWDSGADMSVPRHGSEWLLLVAVGRGDMEGTSRTKELRRLQVAQKSRSPFNGRSWYDYLLLL